MRDSLSPQKSDLIPLAIIIVAVAGGVLLYQEEPREEMTRITEVSTTETTVSLHAPCYDLVMATTPEQTRAIRSGYQETDGRPSTHDTAVNLIQSTDWKMKRVEITAIQDGVYIADIIIEGKGREAIDARPTDAIAMAARTDTPVYVSEPILVSNGDFTCQGTV